jgi:UDPglucose 6-dehydrogenase
VRLRGSCFPKDVKALIAFGDHHDSSMQLLRSVMDVNESQPQRVLDLLARHLPDLAGRAVTVLGMAFKPGTDDIRESPSLAVTDRLLGAGATVTVFDPIAHDQTSKVFGERVSYADSLQAAVEGADAVLVMTRWAEFEVLADLLAPVSPQPVVVDGRRLLNKDAFTRYEAIGL